MSRSHITHMNESCHTRERVAHMNESYHAYELIHMCVKELYHAYERAMSHMWTGHVTHVRESRHTCEWVMSHMWMSQIYRQNAKYVKREPHTQNETCICRKRPIKKTYKRDLQTLCRNDWVSTLCWYIEDQSDERVMSCNTHTHTHSLSLSLSLTHTHTHAHTHTCTHPPSIHRGSDRLKRNVTHTRTHTHIFSLSLSLSLSHTYTLTHTLSIDSSRIRAIKK